jgi:hypothetical protein
VWNLPSCSCPVWLSAKVTSPCFDRVKVVALVSVEVTIPGGGVLGSARASGVPVVVTVKLSLPLSCRLRPVRWVWPLLWRWVCARVKLVSVSRCCRAWISSQPGLIVIDCPPASACTRVASTTRWALSFPCRQVVLARTIPVPSGPPTALVVKVPLADLSSVTVSNVGVLSPLCGSGGVDFTVSLCRSN